MFCINKSKACLPLLAGVIGFCAIQTSVEAAAVRLNAGFAGNTLPGNDDGSTGLVNIGFSLNFFGNNFSQLYVNNNGNATFTAPLGTFTPFPIVNNSTPMLAPFFADVDTRTTTDVTYGVDVVGGRPAFGINWVDVGYYSQNSSPTNSFQLVVIDRSDIAAGDFDFEFNYDRILWETGEASGGNASGLGGSSARAGWTNGTTTSYELAGSAINGALLDGNGTTGLIHNSLNSNVDGRYVFQVRNGVVVNTPEGGQTLALLGLGLLVLAGVRKAAARK